MTIVPQGIRGELRNWREVCGNETSYFAGQMYGDAFHLVKDGTNHTTGTVTNKIDRGDFYLVKTNGPSAYMLYKDREFND